MEVMTLTKRNMKRVEIRVNVNLAPMVEIDNDRARIALSLYGPKGAPHGLVHMTIDEARRVLCELSIAIDAAKIQ